MFILLYTVEKLAKVLKEMKKATSRFDIGNQCV